MPSLYMHINQTLLVSPCLKVVYPNTGGSCSFNRPSHDLFRIMCDSDALMASCWRATNKWPVASTQSQINKWWQSMEVAQPLG